MVFKGAIGLLIIAGVIWFFWMTYIAVKRTKPSKKRK